MNSCLYEFIKSTVTGNQMSIAGLNLKLFKIEDPDPEGQGLTEQ